MSNENDCEALLEAIVVAYWRFTSNNYASCADTIDVLFILNEFCLVASYERDNHALFFFKETINKSSFLEKEKEKVIELIIHNHP